jgi:hypothetical protein
MVNAIQTVISVLFRFTEHHLSDIPCRFRLFRRHIAGKKHPLCIPGTRLPGSFICKHLFFHLLDDYEKMGDDIHTGINLCRLLDTRLALLSASSSGESIAAREHDKSPFI